MDSKTVKRFVAGMCFLIAVQQLFYIQSISLSQNVKKSWQKNTTRTAAEPSKGYDTARNATAAPLSTLPATANTSTTAPCGLGSGPRPGGYSYTTFFEMPCDKVANLSKAYQQYYQQQYQHVNNVTVDYVRGQPIQVLALGGSVTAGNGPTLKNWVQLVERQSEIQWNNKNDTTWIEATNGGIGAVDPKIFPSCLGRLRAAESDVILVELSLNAIASDFIDRFFHTLVTLPNKPLVIYLELISALKYGRRKEQGLDCHQMRPDDPASLAAKHRIPIISQREAMAQLWGTEPFTEDLMYPTADKQHMIDMGHDFVARMVVDFLQPRLRSVKEKSLPDLEYTDPLCVSNYSFLNSVPMHHTDVGLPWPAELFPKWSNPINHARAGQNAKDVIILNTTGKEDVSTRIVLNISQPCELQIGVELCGIPGECDHYGIISAQLQDRQPVKTNLHGKGNPHEPYIFKLQKLFTVGGVDKGEHNLTISSAGGHDSKLVMTGLYCAVG
mmetsp:Transcript_12126/g.17417  ORF Transcript_12126/g.17417 Transcript_12126/m.17417 type:complete len:499 (-) Transcript_12126:1893-3389(-)|eukprot:CAMPEP_0202476260 /NCGR_PEP_ID=MMETSP1360-20130828/93329_1 /ASSEMBLY_ACC=CAM_ASM_000848 /TAXON_ID=515479 /ORGANISM="Licmophora paradoxa, Strain CCMP2313" /LENGTH=498 /DNA_ID=CAMNT_0049103459 /DNA_START=3712 /DNA_END=5208 /DNA_ORIENTATION=+